MLGMKRPGDVAGRKVVNGRSISRGFFCAGYRIVML